MTLSELTPLNRLQAESLFDQHAVLLGECDGIPVHVAAQILIPEAVAYIRTWQCAKYWNASGLNALLPDGIVY